MGPLTTLAISLATKFIPELIGSAMDSKKAEDVAKVVLSAAKTATGHTDAESALNAFEPTAKQIEEMKKDVFKIIELQIGDIQDARDHHDKATDTLSYVVMCGGPVLIAMGIGGLVYVTTLSLTDGVLSTISAVIGGALNQIYQERQQVMNYRFGSSLGSKMKGK